MHHMDNLKHLPRIGKAAQPATDAFWSYDKAVFAEGSIPKKYKELMAVAVALTTQCAYCIGNPRQGRPRSRRQRRRTGRNRAHRRRAQGWSGDNPRHAFVCLTPWRARSPLRAACFCFRFFSIANLPTRRNAS